MHLCAAKCCEDKNGSIDAVQGCIERCSAPVNRAQQYVQKELGEYQGRLQRCVMVNLALFSEQFRSCIFLFVIILVYFLCNNNCINLSNSNATMTSNWKCHQIQTKMKSQNTQTNLNDVPFRVWTKISNYYRNCSKQLKAFWPKDHNRYQIKNRFFLDSKLIDIEKLIWRILNK